VAEETGAVEEPTADEQTADDQTVDQPTADQATVDQPTVDQPTADQATVDQQTGAEPTDEQTAEEPTADEPSVAPARARRTSPALGTGRRKEAVARVRLIEGTGRMILNGRPIDEYFPSRAHRMIVSTPLRLVGREKDFDVIALLDGGGVSGQAGALRQGIARALLEFDSGLRPDLKREGLLTRDARAKERRKYGLKKARKAPQYSKR
jgi:small subunit ribosomal protein S9